MKNLKVIIFIFVVIIMQSCSNSPTLSNPESSEKIKELVSKAVDADKEIYSLEIRTGTLEKTLSTIYHSFKENNTFFSQAFHTSSEKFGDPYKNIALKNKKRKPFKLSDIDLTIIAEKFNEAIEVLKEKSLFKESRDYILTDWKYLTNSKGNITTEFTIQFRLGSSKSGRRITTTYDEHRFKLDKNNEVVFVK